MVKMLHLFRFVYRKRESSHSKRGAQSSRKLRLIRLVKIYFFRLFIFKICRFISFSTSFTVFIYYLIIIEHMLIKIYVFCKIITFYLLNPLVFLIFNFLHNIQLLLDQVFDTYSMYCKSNLIPRFTFQNISFSKLTQMLNQCRAPIILYI